MPRNTSYLRMNGRRPAFTMVELLMAAAASALATTAGATLLFAIANASQQTRDVRATTSAGHYAVNRIGEAIREARAIGQVTSTTMTLWAKDTNSNDAMTLDEMGVIRYNAVSKEVIYQYTNAAGATAIPVPRATFTDFSVLATLIAAAGAQSIVWASDVEAFTLAGYPNGIDTRMVDVRFTLGTDVDAMAFQVAASPKASADYLFYAGTRIEPATGAPRVRRKYLSIWDGFEEYPIELDMTFHEW